ncbi:unnamed protein product, partial [Anisakis simplex]|uniref:G_PROTEIN_RECEP_F1_2 domain-containing protein n=1 Tax=Anisakis simplex TaxID=6269 RepID=A0A0M3J855_ANISI
MYTDSGVDFADSETTSMIVRRSSITNARSSLLKSGSKKGKNYDSAALISKTSKALRSNQIDSSIERVSSSTATTKQHSTTWLQRMKGHVQHAFITRTRRMLTVSRPPLSTTSSGYDKTGNILLNNRKRSIMITRQASNRSTSSAKTTVEKTRAGGADSSFLSTGGMSRKISSLSALTRGRMVHSIFAPFSAFQRQRKQTKAERRAHKAFRTITFIVGFFAILWSPYYVV